MKSASRRHSNKLPDTAISKGAVINMLILLLAFFVLLPRIDQFNTSLEALKSANVSLVGLAFVLGMSTLLFAALTYRLLAGNRISYRRTLAVQIAGTFTNRLLPAGIGGISLNIRYLMKSRFPAGKAGSIAAANNLLGLLGHLLLILIAAAFGGLSFSQTLSFKVSVGTLLLLVAAVFVVGGVFWLFKKLRRKLVRALKEAAAQLAGYRHRPPVLVLSLLSSLMVTLLYVSCFYVCVLAVGLDLPATKVLLVFTLGVAAGTVTPTPGGLVGVEAGMLAGLIGFGLPEAASLSAVLLYRLVTYWLPILPGLATFKMLRYRQVV